MKLSTFSFVVFSCLVSTISALAPTYLSIVGAATGTFSTSDVSKTGAIVSSYSWGVVSPRDLNTGMATGKRRYDVLTITRVPSSMSIQLLNAISRNELLKTVTVVTSVNNIPKRITLSNAYLVSYTESYDAVNGPMETFSISFSKIQEDMNNYYFVDDNFNTGGSGSGATPSSIPMPSSIIVPL